MKKKKIKVFFGINKNLIDKKMGLKLLKKNENKENENIILIIILLKKKEEKGKKTFKK